MGWLKGQVHECFLVVCVSLGLTGALRNLLTGLCDHCDSIALAITCSESVSVFESSIPIFYVRITRDHHSFSFVVC